MDRTMITQTEASVSRRISSKGRSVAGERRTHAVAGITAGLGRAAPLPHFVRHGVEMTVAMVVGMALLTPAYRALLGALGYPDANGQLPELSALAAALSMTAPMVGWMLLRRMGRRASYEMAGAMVLPTVALVALSALGLVPRHALVSLTHCLSSQVMWVVMAIRWRHYAYPHQRQQFPEVER